MYCDVCNLEFYSQVVLDTHLAGSKHQRKVSFLGNLFDINFFFLQGLWNELNDNEHGMNEWLNFSCHVRNSLR